MTSLPDTVRIDVLANNAGVMDYMQGLSRRLVIPLDGSELAEAALPIAELLAANSAPDLTLVFVTPQAGREWAAIRLTCAVAEGRDIRSQKFRHWFELRSLFSRPASRPPMQ